MALANFDEEKRSRRQVNPIQQSERPTPSAVPVGGLSSLVRCKGQGRTSSLCPAVSCLKRVKYPAGLNLTCDSDPRLRRREFALPLRPQSKRA